MVKIYPRLSLEAWTDADVDEFSLEAWTDADVDESSIRRGKKWSLVILAFVLPRLAAWETIF